jgi:hypothetical protein
MTHPNAFHPPATPRELVFTWLRRARDSQMAHYEMADILSRRGRLIGVPVILITTLVGTSVFASVAAETIPVRAKLLVGVLSLLAAVLSGLQTFFKFSERAEKHRVFGARFGAVRRELEALYAESGAHGEPHYTTVLREKLDRLADEALPVPPKVFLRVQGRSQRDEALPQPGTTTTA